MSIPATLLGLTVGDALGAPFEFCNADQIKKSGWEGEYLPTTIWERPLKPGQFTDDGKMAICIAQALAENAKYDKEIVSQNYVKWLNSGDLRGIGSQTSRALFNIVQGVPLSESGRIPRPKKLTFKADYCGNGTVMRAAPIGLFYKDDQESLLKYSKEDAIITHNHRDAQDASFALCNIVGMVANGTHPIEAVSETIELLDDYHVKKKLIEAKNMAEASKKWNDAISLGVDGCAHETIGAATFCFLRYCDESFNTAVISSVSMGGDTDTRTAITGALVGTYVGKENIPLKFIENLELKEFIMALDQLLFLGPDNLKKALNKNG